MRFAIVLVFASLLIGASGPASAQRADDWVISAFGKRCDVTLTKQRLSGDWYKIRVGPRCDREMADLYAWRFGDSSDQMIFYADNREVASVNWRSNTRWEGWITG